MDETLDCLIVGGGPAGLTAALYLARFRRAALVVDTGASRAKWIPRSHNLPGFPQGLHGEDLLERLRTQVRDHGVEILHMRLDELQAAPDGGFHARIGEAQRLCRTVLLATGVVETVPAIAGIAEAIQRGLVRVCPICDGYEAQGKRIGVLGGGDHAAHEALFLRNYSDDVSLVLTPGAELSEAVAVEADGLGVKVLHAGLESVTIEAERVSAVCTGGGHPHHFELIYSAFGITPQVKLARALNVALDPQGRVTTDEHQQTSVKGLYAAGDVVRGLNQISVAEGEATVAASAIHSVLSRNPFVSASKPTSTEMLQTASAS